MISNHFTTKQDLDTFEQKVLKVECPVKNWDKTNHAMNEIVKEFKNLCEGDKYNEHYVQIKKIVHEIKDLDARVKKLSQLGREKGVHLLENFIYDREGTLDHIEYLADQEIRKHVDFVIGEVVYGHTVNKNVFDSVRQYSDLMAVPEGELKPIVFDAYIQKVADEALQNDYTNPTFDMFKMDIISKVQDLMKTHFSDESERALFEDYLNQITDRKWDNIIKTALL